MAGEVGHVIGIRSLTDSDLGIFAAHRKAARSKQRAININAAAARLLFAEAVLDAGGADLECVITFEGEENRAVRRLSKAQKNWRLGGKKLEAELYAKIDSKDFVLIRTVKGNDGSHPIYLHFVSRNVDRVAHAGLAAIAIKHLRGSMAVFEEGSGPFDAFAPYCEQKTAAPTEQRAKPATKRKIPPMPRENSDMEKRAPRSVREKIKQPHIMEQMLKAAGDLSAPAQVRFMETVGKLADQLRTVLMETGGITKIECDHSAFWPQIKGQRIGFVDGGLANLSMLGSAPIAARVGGYSVVPGQSGDDREEFIVLKQLIDELYTGSDEGVYDDSFPDVGALRDAARISIEAAGAVRLISERPDHEWIFTHGALVNPVSRYSDVMQDGKVRHRFPDFSDQALSNLLPADEPERTGRDRNFIAVHLRQLQLLEQSPTRVCGVIEREASTTSVCRAVLDSLDDELIRDLLPVPPNQWKTEFRKAIDPSEDEDYEGQRITDSLLFRCVLEPGEFLLPVEIDRNEIRRAPHAWQDIVIQYPKPRVSYLQVTEFSSPIRTEMFAKDISEFQNMARLLLHCARLLPNYSFPVGLDIVDKFAKIPNWMSRPINTRTAVLALKEALDQNDQSLFNALRNMLCGSGRDFLLRPSILR